LKVHFHYLFIFKTSIAFCFQIGIIFKQFFHRNIIEKKFTCFIFNCYVLKNFTWLFHFSTFFHECYSTRVEKLNKRLSKAYIRLKTFINIYNIKITHLTLLIACKIWICKMKCNATQKKCMNDNKS
jgi:hypothetical protein